MTDHTSHQIKINRAVAQSNAGRYPATCAALMHHLPDDLIDRATGAELALVLDAMYCATVEAKGLAERDACSDGVVWDARRECLREIATPINKST